ncbi:MAG: hypothetical protein ACOYK6_00840 [Chthoniobacterales bacterium]
MLQKIQFSWKKTIFILACIFFAFTVRWSLIDHSPPRWDESLYLVESTMHHQALLSQGIIGCITSIFNADRGRVPLLTVLVQPSFLLFGPKLPVAVISMGLLWFLLAWSFYTIGTILNKKNGAAASALAFFLFGIYPQTTVLTNYFLVEFLLVSLVTTTYALGLKYLVSRKNYYLWLLGIAISLGMLAKVTFPVFLIPIIALSWKILSEQHNKENKIKFIATIIFCIIVLAIPYYIYNFTSLVTMTRSLSSSKITELYGFFPVWSFQGAIEYFHSVFYQPIPTLMMGGLCFLIIQQVIPKTKIISNSILLIALISAIIPFLFVAFGTVKDSRYSYPALPIIFILGSLGIAGCFRNIISTILVLIYLLFFIKISFISTFLTAQGLNFKLLGNTPSECSAPDPQNWKIGDIVSEVDNLLSEYKAPHTLLFLGGNRYYHINLFRYYLLYLKKNEINFITLPYYEKDCALPEAMAFIEKNKIKAILFKTGENYPPFSFRLTPEIVESLHHNQDYDFKWLATRQPDGSQFGIFLLKNKDN